MTEKKTVKELGNTVKIIPLNDDENEVILIKNNRIRIFDAPKKEVGRYGVKTMTETKPKNPRQTRKVRVAYRKACRADDPRAKVRENKKVEKNAARVGEVIHKEGLEKAKKMKGYNRAMSAHIW